LGEVLKMAMICLSLIVAGEKPKVQEKVSAHEVIQKLPPGGEIPSRHRI
jgi:hypothetical protein